MNAYYYHSPRGFANEYTILVAERGSEVHDWLAQRSRDAAYKTNPDERLYEIDRDAAIRLGIRRPRESARTSARLNYDDGYGHCTMNVDAWECQIVGGGLSDSEIIRAAKAQTRFNYEEMLERERREATYYASI